jgi:hypothetical protein
MSKSNIIYGILLLVILVLLYIVIFRKPEVVVEPFDETPLREEIAKKDSIAQFWENEAHKWETVAHSYEAKSDSLETLKPQIQEHYGNTYKIIPDGTNVVLDSIIRANW